MEVFLWRGGENMEIDGKKIRNAEFKQRFYNPDGTFEDLSNSDIKHLVEQAVKEELGMTIDEVYKNPDFELLERYFEIDNKVRTDRRSDSIYVIGESIFTHRRTVSSTRSCYDPGKSVVVFRGIEGEEQGRSYQAEIEGGTIILQAELKY
jgi:basic membrane lipoprotein Med (substrate-binding protein (PBP1-ABC) superfamily)